ncbi:hypothetical protein H0H87_008155 [Tephrocybe sp. NHM501043]|nr:hypothetical protein H0H87_008155 [Tephrocybe sp. NHM501043]
MPPDAAGSSIKNPQARALMQPVVLNAALVARIHTCLAYTAFITALVVACACHYKKVVKNGVAGYPEEWFPSVSATIGDWYPERNLFQILIALTAAYTHYSFFEWGLIFFDVLYDAQAEYEYTESGLQVTLGPRGVEKVKEVVIEKISGRSPTNEDAVEKNMVPNGTLDSAEKRTFLRFLRVSPSLRLAADFISDVYLSYIFWSIFTSLIPTLFYFSVWELGIAGHELALLSTLSPFLLGIDGLFGWATSREGQMALWLVGLVPGLGAVVLQSPVLRLLAVAPAMAVVVLGQVSKWTRSFGDGEDGISMALGLIVASLSKHLNHSNNPMWPFINSRDTPYNVIGLVLALAAVCETYTRPTYPSSTNVEQQERSPLSSFNAHWITAALPFGSLLFTLHNMFSDPSTLIAWSWTGYHDRAPKGPVPHLHASLTLIAQCAGLLLSMFLSSPLSTELLTHPVWLTFGAFNAYVVYAYRNWEGYVGGLGLAVFSMAVAPVVLQQAVQVARAAGVAKVFGTGMGVYCVLNLASIFTVADMQLDVVGLLETDLYRTAFGHRDLTRVAVEELGYYVDIGPGPNSHTWGAALLSKFPIINSTHHLLPSPHGELAPAIEAVLDIFGTEITVVVAHNGQEEDPLDRELQSRELARIMSASHPRPVVFLGYVVTKPHADRPAPYKILIEDGQVFDIDQDDPDRWCEYILYRGLYRTSYARISRGSITDTELQLGQFALPKHGTRLTNETQTARYLRIPKETLPEHHWFPMEYYGNEIQGGVNGHFYHVFGTPLYYNFPENAVL